MPEIVSKNPVNEPAPKIVDARSTFDLHQNLANTERFGDITPRFAMEVVPKDKLPYSFGHTLRSHTLGAPFMGEINRNEDAFFVPAEAILPLNWDKLYTNPLIGDDVDAASVGCTCPDFVRAVSDFFSSNISNLKGEMDNVEDPDGEDMCSYFTAWLKMVLGIEMIYSNGSLLSVMGAHFSSLCSSPSGNSVDKFIDSLPSLLSPIVDYFQFVDGANSWFVELVPGSHPDDGYPTLSFREFLVRARDGYSWSIDSIAYVSGKSLSDLWSLVYDNLDFDFVVLGDVVPLNLARFFAYQIVCATYYTNDKIDYVYDANLYRQNVYDAWVSIGTEAVEFFTLNGSVYRYDYLSNYFFIKALETIDVVYFVRVLDYLRLIFGFNHSLRYVDYFTGSKSRPLAVGDVNVGVSSNKVNVVDITRNIQRQRFLNAVNRAGRRISEYVKAMFGVSQAPDYHNPFFLSHTRDFVGSQEVENTGSAQLTDANSVTSMLRSGSERFQFEFEGDRPGILLGVAYYDIERYYYKGVERLMTHIDRYDMFNPFMQFTGDQDLKGFERDVNSAGSTFGYQQRYMEYKQRYSQASGGFIEYLPGWIFLADERPNEPYSWTHVSPSYIRSMPTELDPFYTSLVNLSLAGYFHFIVINRNRCDGSRPMAFNPSIL